MGPTPEKLGVQMYTVRDAIQSKEGMLRALETIGSIGYRAVEMSPWGPLEPAELRAVLQSRGLTLCAAHFGLERLGDELQRIVDALGFFGCRHVVVSGSPAIRGEDAYRRLADELSAAGKSLSSFGVRLSYHNHQWEFERLGKKTGLEILMEAGDPEALHFEIDTYWVQYGGGDPAAWIRRAKGRIRLVHLKDMTAAGREAIMAEVGYGNLNWPAIFDACAASGVEWYVVEQDHCRRDPFESLKMSFESIREMGRETA